MPTVVDILEDALAIVSHDGWWTQGHLCISNGPKDQPSVCAMGAIGVADGTIPAISRTARSFRTISSEKLHKEYEIPGEVFEEGFLTPEGEDATIFLIAAMHSLHDRAVHAPDVIDKYKQYVREQSEFDEDLVIDLEEWFDEEYGTTEGTFYTPYGTTPEAPFVARQAEITEFNDTTATQADIVTLFTEAIKLAKQQVPAS